MRPYAQDPEQFLIDSRGDLMGQEFARGGARAQSLIGDPKDFRL